MTVPTPELGAAPKVSVHVVVDADTHLSIVHEPGSPLGGYLQVAGHGGYIALEIPDIAAARRMAELTLQLEHRIIDATVRRAGSLAARPPAKPIRHVDSLIRETLVGIHALRGDDA